MGGDEDDDDVGGVIGRCWRALRTVLVRVMICVVLNRVWVVMV